MEWTNINNGDDGLDIRNKLNSILQFLINPPVAEINTNYSINGATDKIILVSASSGDIIITLPPLSDTNCESNIFIIIKIDDSEGKVIIDGYGFDQIAGQDNVVLSYQWEIYKLLKHSSTWIPIY